MIGVKERVEDGDRVEEKLEDGDEVQQTMKNVTGARRVWQ